MSHDFAKTKNNAAKSSKKPAAAANRRKKTAHKSGSGNIPGWLFFVSGVICTLAVQFLFHLIKQDNQLSDTIEQARKAGQEVVEKTPRPDITFYKTLPKMEVDVTVEPVPKRDQETYNYVLQAGAFRSLDDANQQRAEIILLGLDAVIESHTNDSGTTWHRVIVGPFTSRSDLNQARNQLVNNNMPTLTISRN